MKKGISPIFASILLIAITVLVAGIVMSWMTQFSETQTDVISNRSTGIIQCTAADIEIQAVYLDFKANVSRLTVRNSGRVDDVIISAKVYNNLGQNTANITEFPITFVKGDLMSLELNMTGVIETCANFSQATVSTSCTSDAFTSSDPGLYCV